jgi:ketosteroid isomerase-like protein
MTQSLIDRWYAAIRTGDAAALRNVVTEDVVLLWNGDPARLPWAGRHSGADAVLAFFKTLGADIEVVSVSQIYRLDAADAVVVASKCRDRTSRSARR